MMSTRTDKIASVLQKEISCLFAEVLDQYDYGMVTVTGVRVLEDLSEARVSVSCLQNPEGLIDMLTKRTGYIRRTISPRLPIKRLPKLIFSFDDSGKYVQKISQLLHN